GGALRIGGNNIWGEWFSGLVDDVRIYSQPLTASQIQTDMNTPVKGAKPGDTQAPSTPTGLKVTSTTMKSISLSWNASSDNVGVASYGVYRNGTFLENATGTSYTAAGL